MKKLSVFLAVLLLLTACTGEKASSVSAVAEDSSSSAAVSSSEAEEKASDISSSSSESLSEASLASEASSSAGIEPEPSSAVPDSSKPSSSAAPVSQPSSAAPAAVKKSMRVTYPDSLTVRVGETVEAFITSDSDTALTLTAEGTRRIEVETNGESLSLTGVEEGSAAVAVTASAEGYASVEFEISVTVAAEAKALPQDVDIDTYADLVEELCALINDEREARGLSSLRLRKNLCILASLRAEEASEVWAHTRPDGSSWSTILEEYGITYRAGVRGAAENLFAANILDAETAAEGWMNSDSHRENILTDSYTATGLGIFHGDDGYYYYAQIFLAEN